MASDAEISEMIDLTQSTVRQWNSTNWPEKGEDLLTHAAKVAEEMGEVLGAIIKARETGRERPQDEILQEMGDVMVTLFSLAEVVRQAGLTDGNLWDIFMAKWEQVRTYRTEAGRHYDERQLAMQSTTTTLCLLHNLRLPCPWCALGRTLGL